MQDPIYNRIVNTKRPSVFAASGLVLLAAIGLWASSLAASLLPEDSALTAASLLYYLPFAALPVALYLWRRPGCRESLRLNPPPELPLLGVALLALLTAYAASGLTALWDFALDALGLHEPATAGLPRTKQELSLSILLVAALPAVCEELLFRGFVLSAWEGRGTAFAIGVTAGLFALLHANLYGLPAYLMVGVISGCVTFALDSVYAGMIYHTLYNAAVLILSFLLSGQTGGEAAEAASASGSVLLPVALTTFTTLSLIAALLVTLLLRARNAGIMAVPRVRRPLERRDKVMLAAALLAMAASTVIVLAV